MLCRHIFPGKSIDRGSEESDEAKETNQRPHLGKDEDLGWGSRREGASELHGYDGKREGPEKPDSRP